MTFKKRTIERNMFYGAKPYTFEKAKLLRDNMTQCEQLLWKKINNKQILGLRFKSQHPIDRFIADFYCHKIKLVVEVDGEIHEKDERKEYDLGRTDELEKYGITVIRLKNNDVLSDINNVVLEILNKCINLLDER